MIDIKNIFREDFSQVIGIYFDGEKIFLAREEEIISAHFEVEEENFAEQLAEKVLVMCNQSGWESSKVALCLREGESMAVTADFENLPIDKRASAVKSWATAQVGENALYTFAEVDGEFWAETISQSAAEKFLSAFGKNSMTLCAMTSLASRLSKSADKAKFISKVAAEKIFPNLLRQKTWNVPKIILTTLVIIFAILSVTFGAIFYRHLEVDGELENLQKTLAAQEEVAFQKKSFESATAESKRLNKLLAAQYDNRKFNAMIQLGRIADEKVSLSKVNFTKDTVEVEGLAENSTEVKKYLGRFKNAISKEAKLEKITTEDDKVSFKIRLDLKDRQ